MKGTRNQTLANALRVFAVLADGRWHALRAFTTVTELPAHTIRRTLRTLAEDPFYCVECKRSSEDERALMWRSRWWRSAGQWDVKGFIQPKVKECNSCHIVSYAPQEDFHRDSRMADGLVETCKRCRVATVKRWRERNREVINRRQRAARAAQRKRELGLVNSSSAPS